MIRSLILLWTLSLTTGEDSTVTCLFSKECVLPCKSSYHDVIHWQKINGSNTLNVHSFYTGADQFQYQDEAYSRRTSLFSDQISKGNASLILRDVRIQDQGQYNCYTAITTKNKEALVTLKVKAPVESVDIKLTDDGITCKASEIYPEPRIVWYINGRETQASKHDSDKDSQGLFSLTSTVKAFLGNPEYVCSFSFDDKTHMYNGSLKQENAQLSSGQDLSITCPVSQDNSRTFTETFTLTFEDSSTILSYNSQTLQPLPSVSWRGTDITVTPEWTFTLHKLDTEKHNGMYTCERVTPLSRQLVQTTVQIKEGQKEPLGTTIGIVIFVIIAIIAIVCVVVFTIRHVKRRTNNENTPRTEQNGNDRGTRGTNTDTSEETIQLSVIRRH